MIHACRIEDACLIGMQATILDNAVVGAPPSGFVLKSATGPWFPGGFGTLGEGDGDGATAAATAIGTEQRADSRPADTLSEAM